MEGRQREQHPLSAGHHPPGPGQRLPPPQVPAGRHRRIQTVSFELDLNDQAGLALLQSLQTYSDGTTLADHISPELYQRVQAQSEALGLGPNGLDAYKPWALASTFSTLSMMDETTGANAMAIDTYVNARAVNAGKTIDAVETYAFQGGIFDGLSAEYQETYLDSALAVLEMAQGGQTDPAIEQAAQEQEEMMSGMFAAWKARDPRPLPRCMTRRPSSTATTSSTPSCSPSGIRA